MSERMERYKTGPRWDDGDDDREIMDREFCDRIIAFLNDPQIDRCCLVDADYYDYSGIPDSIRVKFDLPRDAYLIF